jgi:hypothetical protein
MMRLDRRILLLTQFRRHACLLYRLLLLLWTELFIIHKLMVYHSSSGGTQTSNPSLSIFIPSVGAILSTFCV